MIDQHTFSFDLPIWKLLYDTSESTDCVQYLAIETRDKDQVMWSVVDVETNETIWQKTLPETNWWTTLSGFDGQYLILDCYSGTNEPTPSQKIYVALLTGQITTNSYKIQKLTTVQANTPLANWQNLTAYQDSDVYYDTIAQFIEKIIDRKSVV